MRIPRSVQNKRKARRCCSNLMSSSVGYAIVILTKSYKHLRIFQTRFSLERASVKYQYIKDIGTQYTDEYNFNRHINITDSKGNSMFLIAAQNGALNIAKFLLKKSANPNHQNAQGQSALHYAMAYDFFEFGSWLTSEDGAKVDDYRC